MWRVQATSGTTQSPKEWSPFLVRTRLDALRAARDVRRTLAHFPDVRVGVRRATEADVEELRLRAEEREADTAATVIHRTLGPTAELTVCGIRGTGLTALVSSLDLWGDSPRHCPDCHPVDDPVDRPEQPRST